MAAVLARVKGVNKSGSTHVVLHTGGILDCLGKVGDVCHSM